ncbi:MAG: hypothetical protein K2N87_12410 [Eubacterium sp.]|nr:hypothetical protein [Eubacterium sp.]
MEYKRELLQSRIAEIKDPIQKRLLQDVLIDVFSELLDYSEQCFLDLEHKIDQEYCDPDSHYYLYTGICKKDGIDSASRSLFEVPMQKERDEMEKGYLGTMFLACDYPSVLQCMSKAYPVHVQTDKGEYETTAALFYCKGYLKTFRRLYEQFGANQRQWHTIHCPYLYKFLDIVDQEGKVPYDAVIQKVSIELGEFSGFVMDDMVLVWNVSEIVCKPKVDVAAAGIASYYIHQIPLDDLDAGYLAAPEGEEQFSVVFSDSKRQLLVRTEKEAHPELKLLKIEPICLEKDHTALLYPLQSNQRILRHADRQALKQPRFLWTKGEVVRMLSSYEVFRDFELLDIRPDMQGNRAIDMNPFIHVHSFLKQKRKIALILHAKDATDIFRYEKMFFLLAELQLCTQEYEWTGILQ